MYHLTKNFLTALSPIEFLEVPNNLHESKPLSHNTSLELFSKISQNFIRFREIPEKILSYRVEDKNLV